MGRIVGMGLGLALALTASAGAVAPLQAQVVIGEQTECRCVDADGNRIEECTCMRTPRIPLQSFTLSGMGLDRRARIGVYIDMDQDDAAVGGVRISEVAEDSPAESAGIRVGDVVIMVDGVSVLEELEEELEADLDEDMSLATQRFVEIVGDLEPEEEAAIVVLRDGSRVTIEVLPEAASAFFAFGGGDGAEGFTFRAGDGSEGITIRGNFEMDEEERRAFEEEMTRAAEELRAFNFRFDERDRQELQREVERAQVEALRMREMRQGEMRELQELAQELQRSRAGELRELEEEYARVFTRKTDPCMSLYASEGSRVMVLGGDACIDGLRLADMNEGLSAYFGTDTGVLVTEVAETSSLGLEAGDVVLRVGDRSVEDAEDLRRILQSYDSDEPVNFRVRREDREIQVSGTRRSN